MSTTTWGVDAVTDTLHRERVQVASVFAAAILAHLLLFKYVGIWGDFGFYTYDSRLILNGQQPFINFLGRSPAMIYLWAWVRGVVGHPIVALRAFIISLWLLTGIPVYLLGRRIGDHASATVALTIFLVSPFSLVYGMWANTMSTAALFGTTAIYLRLRKPATRWLVVVGGLLAIAYLARRSIIVLLFAVVLYEVVRLGHTVRDTRQMSERDIARVVGRGVALLVGFGGVLLAGYAAIAGGDVQTTVALFETHTVNLFITYGRGGWPLLGESPPIIKNQVKAGRVPILNDLCSTCGAWTARTLAKTLLVTAPAVGIGWVYLRDLTDEQTPYLVAAMAALGGYGLVQAMRAGYYTRAGTIFGVALFAVVVYRHERLSREVLYERQLQLVLLIIGGLFAGYLYRNRVLHTYYFMDFWPYISIVAGIVYTRLWPGLGRVLRYTLIAAVVLSTMTAFASAHPLTTIVADDNEDGWFTIENAQAYQDDLNQRTDPGDVVFTAEPTYVAGSHARLPMDNPRIHMVVVRYPDTGPGLRVYRNLIDGFRSGEIEYVILGWTTKKVLEWNGTAALAFTTRYCAVESAEPLYDKTHSTLYRYAPNASDCAIENRPDLTEVRH